MIRQFYFKQFESFFFTQVKYQSTQFNCQTVLLDPKIGPYQVLPLRARVDQRWSLCILQSQPTGSDPFWRGTIKSTHKIPIKLGRHFWKFTNFIYKIGVYNIKIDPHSKKKKKKKTTDNHRKNLMTVFWGTPCYPHDLMILMK